MSAAMKRALPIVAALFAIAAPAAHADATISITPPSEPDFAVFVDGSVVSARTTHPQPTFALRSDTAGTFTCDLTSATDDVTVPCPAPPDGCRAVQCASYRP